jgi:hypothetical protein
MEDTVMVDITADALVDIAIKNTDGEVDADVTDGYPSVEFDGRDFLYIDQYYSDEDEEDEDATDATVYMPKSGYSIHLSSGTLPNVPVNLTVRLSTLDHDGYETATAEYHVTLTGAGGSLLSLDLTDEAAADVSNLGSIGADTGGSVHGAVADYLTDWVVEPEKTLDEIGATDMIAVSGDDVDADKVKAEDLLWESSDPEIVSVDEYGEIEALDFGRATIYASLPDGGGYYSSCDVVVPLCAETLSLGDVSLTVGNMQVLEPVFDHPDVTQDEIEYSFDESRGIIDIEYGVVTGLRPGTISVTGKAEGGAEDSFTVTVLPEGATVGGGGGGGSSTGAGNPGDKDKGDDSDTAGSGSAGGNDLGTLPLEITVEKIADCAYTGRQVKPVPVVTKGGQRLTVGKDYTVSYGANKSVGIGKVTVRGIGAYTGERTVQFRIVPRQVSLKTITAGNGRLTAKWKKSSADQQVTQYQVRYRANGSGVWKVRTVASKKATLTIAKLKAGKVYQLEIRACKQIGKELYSSSWSLAKASPRVK